MNALEMYELEEVQEYAAILGHLMDQTEGFKEGFKIEDLKQAEWALRKIKVLKTKINTNNELAEAEIERIENWRARVNEEAEKSIAFFEMLLHSFMLKERERDPKLKNIKLPHGTLRLRKQQPEFIKDENALIQWAKDTQRPEYIKIKESFDWAGLKKNIQVVGGQAIDKTTGELIESVKVVERDDKFEVDVDETNSLE